MKHCTILLLGALLASAIELQAQELPLWLRLKVERSMKGPMLLKPSELHFDPNSPFAWEDKAAQEKYELQMERYNRAQKSIEPIKQMTWLKNLWVPTRSGIDKLALIEALPNTRVVTSDPATSFISSTERCPDGLGWRNLKNYYDSRDMLNEGTNGWLDGQNKRYMQ